MPKVEFKSENKVKSGGNDFPKLTLEHNERALIVCIESSPEMEYRHNLNMPRLDEQGKIIMETRQSARGDYERPATDFVGQHLCFGNFEVLEDKGIDPDNCPTCAAAKNGEGIDPPKPHYAMHVLRYSLRPNSWQLSDPFSVSCVAWVFPPKIFNTLTDLAAEWGNLQTHDLKLGPCESKQFQKFDIQVAARAEWLADDARKQIAKQTYANNRTDDLSSLISRRVEKSQALEDIARVQERINEAYHRNTPVAASAATQAAVSADVEELLSMDTPKGSDNVPDPFGEPTPGEAAAAESIAPAENPGLGSFEDILADL